VTIPIRVVIADDQALMRAGFRMILEAQPDIQVVAEAADGAEAVAAVRELRPDVVLMDIRMPGMDGIEATRQLEGERVLILTTFHDDEYVVGALRAGARGFLLKDAPPADLIAAVRTLHADGALLAPAVTMQLLERLRSGSSGLDDDGRADARPELLDTLTERELDVLRLVARGMSNAEIAAQLVVGEATVKTHVSHVLAKLRARDRVHAVIAAYDAGLVRPGDARSSASA
jgi:DNA-binding NarL/FixJ family response regulator